MKVLLTNLLLFLAAANALADPRLWDSTGIVVRPYEDLSWSESSARNADGYVAVAWTEQQNWNGDIRAQLFSPADLPLWGEHGAAVCTAPGDQASLRLVAVDGGWIFLWADLRTGASEIRAQKLNLAGEPQWSADGYSGVVIATEAYAYYTALASDRAGGAFVAWSVSQNIGVQRLLASGGFGWEEPVWVLDTPRYGIGQVSAAESPDGVVLAWQGRRETPLTDVFVTKLLRADGHLAWASNGIQVSDHVRDDLWPSIVPDGQGGGYIGWTTGNGDRIDSFMVQHVGSDGQLLWPGNGVVATWGQTSLLASLAASYNGSTIDGCLVVRGRHTGMGPPVNQAVIVYKLAPDGTQIWTTSGVEVCNAPSFGHYLYYPDVCSDYQGGAGVAWVHAFDRPTGRPRSAVAGRVLANGTIAWSGSCGVPVAADTTSSQADPVVEWLNGHLLVCWTTTDGGFETLRAQSLQAATGAPELPVGGITVVQRLSGDVDDVETVPLGLGNTALMWNDGRGPGYSNIYFQILDTTGTSLLAATGVPLLTDPTGLALSPGIWRVCPDSLGGFFVAVTTFQNQQATVRVVHRTAMGAPQGPPLGAALYTGPSESASVQVAGITPDGQGGVYVGWSVRNQGTADDAYLQHLDGSLNILWPQPIEVNHTANYDWYAGLAADPASGCFVALTTANSGWSETTLFLVSPGATVLWSHPLTDTSDVRFNRMVPDGAGGVYLAWTTEHPEYYRRLHLGRLDALGVMQWGDRGRVLPTAGGEIYDLQLLTDPELNLLLAWRANESSWTTAIRAGKWSPGGAPQWSDSGLVIVQTDSAGWGYLDDLCSDGGGGLVAVWSEGEFGFTVLRAIHINRHGDPGNDTFWQPLRGGLLSTPGQRASGAACASSPAGVTVAWAEGVPDEYSFESELRAQRLRVIPFLDVPPQPQPPRTFALYQNYPNPFNPRTEIRFDLPEPARVELTIYNLLGQEVATLADGLRQAGTHQLFWDGLTAEGLPAGSGLYFYRLRAGSFADVKRMLLLR